MSKQQKNRQAVVDEIRREQKAADRRRSGLIVAVAVLIGVVIIGAAAYKPISDWWELREFESQALSEIGAGADACQEIITKDATGAQDHVTPGSPLTFEDSPPAFGQHYDVWDSMDRKFYTSDRPELGELVHNLEHGYTILWYDETIADDGDQMAVVRGLASKFEDNDNLRNKFKAVPWTDEDGDAFPDDQHVALTHWSIGGVGNESAEEQVGVWQYCSEPSGAALEQFMKDYPYMDSPEPNAV